MSPPHTTFFQLLKRRIIAQRKVTDNQHGHIRNQHTQNRRKETKKKFQDKIPCTP